MALIDFAGFEDPLTGQQGLPDVTKWSFTNGANGNLTGVPTPRTGSACFRSNGGSAATQTRGGMARTLDGTEENATLIAGLAVQRQSLAMGGTLVEFGSDTNATCHVSVMYSIAGAISVYRGDVASGTVLATSANVLTATATWYYIEVKATLHDSTGAVEIRLNQTPVAGLTLTNVDTKNAGTKTVFDTAVIGKAYVNNTSTCHCIDDFYLLNGVGPAPLQDFLGGVAIYRQFPNGNGSSSQFVNSASNSTNNSTYVDDTTTAEYVQSATVGNRDLYTMADLAGGLTGSVYGVKLRASVQNTDGTLRNLKLGIKSGATVDMDAGASVGAGTAQINNRLMKVNPATTNYFTLAEVNALEIGYEVG